MTSLLRVTLAGLTALLLGGALFTGQAWAQPPHDFTTRVTTDTLNVRARPSTAAPIVGAVHGGDLVTVVETVDGEEVLDNNVSWFRLPSGGFIYSAYTAAGGGLNGSTASPGRTSTGRSGRWIEIDRSAQIARAFEDGEVVYTAPVTVGVQAFPTPVGQFRILRRVFNETMDSSTIGIPRNAPGGYFLRNVLYTQYITNDGVALHLNYWSPPSAFGNYPTSHGCIGLREADARFFWNFASIGTPVIVTA
ncbi:MAG TPA: L,D-transpeptidase family protein [Chloroflexota bacterium]